MIKARYLISIGIFLVFFISILPVSGQSSANPVHTVILDTQTRLSHQTPQFFYIMVSKATIYKDFDPLSAEIYFLCYIQNGTTTENRTSVLHKGINDGDTILLHWLVFSDTTSAPLNITVEVWEADGGYNPSKDDYVGRLSYVRNDIADRTEWHNTTEGIEGPNKASVEIIESFTYPDPSDEIPELEPTGKTTDSQAINYGFETSIKSYGSLGLLFDFESTIAPVSTSKGGTKAGGSDFTVSMQDTGSHVLLRLNEISSLNTSYSDWLSLLDNKTFDFSIQTPFNLTERKEYAVPQANIDVPIIGEVQLYLEFAAGPYTRLYGKANDEIAVSAEFALDKEGDHPVGINFQDAQPGDNATIRARFYYGISNLYLQIKRVEDLTTLLRLPLIDFPDLIRSENVLGVDTVLGNPTTNTGSSITIPAPGFLVITPLVLFIVLAMWKKKRPRK
ncbi:MAG: hypothetical protein ACFFC7_18485 [Candidatus Hermodarchaeota archaeon]